MTLRSQTSAHIVSSYSDSDDVVSSMSSQHMWNTWIHLLQVTLNPLVTTTNIVDDVLFVILGSTSDQRRRIGIVDNQTCLNEAYHMLFKPSEDALNESLITLGVERGVYQWFIDAYLLGTYEPEITVNDFCERSPMQEYVGEMYSLYISFRKKVADRFSKLIKSQASKDTWSRIQMGLQTSIGDTENNYTLAVIRALDRFHPSQGTLAGYVSPWLQNAGSSKYTMYDGEAFGLSRPIRKMVHDGKASVNNKAYSLELAESLPDEMVVTENSNSLSLMFQSMRTSSLLSFIMCLYNYPTCLTVRELDILKFSNDGNSFSDISHNIEDLPTIMPLSRASRRQTEQSDRRKSLIHAGTKRRLK